MPEINVPNDKLIAVFNALNTLQAWLRPGYLSMLVGEHIDALTKGAERFATQRNALLDECAMRYPETVVDGPDAGTPHPKAGQFVLSVNDAGQEIVLYKSPEAGQYFLQREAELLEKSTPARVSERLTRTMLKSLDSERLPEMHVAQGAKKQSEPVDFAALLTIVDDEPDASQPTPTKPTTNGASSRRAFPVEALDRNARPVLPNQVKGRTPRR